MQMVYALDELRLFWLREKPEDPQFEPHAGIKMAQILESPVYIYGGTLISGIAQWRHWAIPFQTHAPR